MSNLSKCPNCEGLKRMIGIGKMEVCTHCNGTGMIENEAQEEPKIKKRSYHRKISIKEPKNALNEE